MREGSLILDHPGQTSTVSGWKNSWMERHSLVLRRGSRLELSDVVTMRAAQEAVLLEEEATIKISNLKAVYRSYHVFSVSSRDQVLYSHFHIHKYLYRYSIIFFFIAQVLFLAGNHVTKAHSG